MSNDWIPSGQDAFVDWSQQFVAALNEHGSALGLAAALITAVTTRQGAFMESWTNLQAQGKSAVKTAAKKTLIAEHRRYVRNFFNKNLRYNDNLTDELRVLLGVPRPDHTRTHFDVGDRRVGFEIIPKGVYLVGMRCWDEESGEKKILHGMNGIVVIYAVSDAPLTETAALTQSTFITKTSHTFKGVDGQRGKWLSATCCWQSRTGQRGPWAAVKSTVIP